MEENLNSPNQAKGWGDKITLPLSIIIAGALIAGGIYLNGKLEKSPLSPTEAARQSQTGGTAIKSVLRPIDESDHILGSPSARIVLVEYSDTECPFCKVLHNTMNTIMKEYGSRGEVAWVYRHFPIPELHTKAVKEAQALECAAELGGNSKFWEYANKVYELTPSNDGLDLALLPKIAGQIGLDTTEFTTCLESGSYVAKIQADAKNAFELGALGTPYNVLIDTKTGEYYPLEGAYPYAQLKQIIDLILES